MRLLLADARDFASLADRGEHQELGFASVGELAESLGYSAREGRALYALGRALAGWPGLLERILDGRLNPEKAAALARLLDVGGALRAGEVPGADPDPWLAAAEEEATQDFLQRVSRRCEEALRGVPVERMSFLVTQAGMADFRRCRGLLSRRANRRFTRGETLELVASRFLDVEDPLRVAGRARRVPDTSGPGIDRTAPGPGLAPDPGPAPDPEPGELPGPGTPSPDDLDSVCRKGRILPMREPPPASTPGSPDAGSPDAGSPTTGSPTTGPGGASGRGSPPRSSRYVPAEVRRAVLARAGGRCEFPRCGFDTWLDLAHLVPHRAGGSREADNLVLLCGVHHRALDAGTLEAIPVRDDSLGRDEGGEGGTRVHFRTPWGEELRGPVLAAPGGGPAVRGTGRPAGRGARGNTGPSTGGRA